MSLLERLKKIRFLIIGLAVIFLIIFLLARGEKYEEKDVEYGVTFSQKKALEMGLDWKEAYTAILNDLEIKKIRLSAYWDEVEPKNNAYSWQDLDWQIDMAGKKDAEIILAMGGRLPRWPECHFPDWVQTMDKEEWHREALKYIEKTVNRYKDNDNIVAWQVENEPYLSSMFGHCPPLDRDFLTQEIQLVRDLDSRPIVVTDSGELSLWIPAARRADIFGTTMYKNTYSGFLKRYVSYPIGPGFFHFKKNVTDLFASPDKWIVIELQAEPWGPIPYQDMTPEERSKTMDLQKLRSMIKLARESGFKELYLWGVEWWYWEKVKNDNPQYWQEVKQLINK
jgi:hypothetical protein